MENIFEKLKLSMPTEIMAGYGVVLLISVIMYFSFIGAVKKGLFGEEEKRSWKIFCLLMRERKLLRLTLSLLLSFLLFRITAITGIVSLEVIQKNLITIERGTIAIITFIEIVSMYIYTIKFNALIWDDRDKKLKELNNKGEFEEMKRLMEKWKGK